MKYFTLLLSLTILLTACKKEENKKIPLRANARYSVTYKGNGHSNGSVPHDSIAYIGGAQALVLDNSDSLVKNGYVFAGWNSAADGKGSGFLPGSELTVSTNILLYAKWESNANTITYDGNGQTSGSVPVDNTSYPAGAKHTVKNNTGSLLKHGNAFKKWNTAPDGSGSSYWPGDKVTMDEDITLYAIYNTGISNTSKYIGFSASGQAKSKSSTTSTWSLEDMNNIFGPSQLVGVVWDGLKYVGFNATGQAKSKTSLNSPWLPEDMSNTFGPSGLVAVVWNGSKYVGFNAAGQLKAKTSLTASWSSEDESTFGASSVVSVVWNGSKYIGFNALGEIKSKSSLSGSWSSEDMTNTFGSSNLVAVVWDGSRYIGFSDSGQLKAKSSLTSTWSSIDMSNLFGSSALACAVFK